MQAEAVMSLLFKAAWRTGGTETVSYLYNVILKQKSGDWSNVSGNSLFAYCHNYFFTTEF